ncbi:MAG: hypothetical protein WDA42_02795 [Candidatus Bathyarchaeia archaeon]
MALALLGQRKATMQQPKSNTSLSTNKFINLLFSRESYALNDFEEARINGKS